MNHTVRSLIVLTGLSGLLLSGCSAPEQPQPAPPPTLTGITLYTVSATSVPETVEVVGTVRARTSAVVAARIPGSIALLQVREGDRVRKGQLLAQLSSTELLAQAAGSQAQLEEARQGVAEAQARQQLAEATFERFRSLFEEQALTRQEFEQKRTEHALAQQGLARAAARLRQAQEQARAAATMADHTRITAPISGVITLKQTDLGSTVFPGQPLLTIEDPGSFQLELAIPESLSGTVRPGTPVQITLEAVQASLTARIAEVVPTTDPASRTFIAKVPLTQAGLTSGMYGRARLSTAQRVPALLVPQSAVFERGALTAVWTVGTDHTVRMRLIKPGRSVADRVEVLAGLSEGDRVATSGLRTLTDGARIAP